MKKYKILWIDDQWEELSSFKDLCELVHDIEVIPCRYAVEGMKLFEEHLQSWSAVILDAKVLMNADNEVAGLKGLQHSVNRIHELSLKRYVPTFILTGQPDLFSNETFSEVYGKFYEKAKDEEQLIHDIKQAADQLVVTHIRKKYGNILEIWPERESEIINILTTLELSNSKNSTCLNEIRKMLEDVMERISQSGLLLVNYTSTNLEECSRFLGQKWLQVLIPIYIQRSIHSCVEMCNPGSHRTDLEMAIKEGRAPFVLNSTIFELLNILYWCKNLKDLPKKEEVSLMVKGLKAQFEEEKNKQKNTES